MTASKEDPEKGQDSDSQNNQSDQTLAQRVYAFLSKKPDLTSKRICSILNLHIRFMETASAILDPSGSLTAEIGKS